MNSDSPLDYALFQLSPRRTRCELFISGGGSTEKLASGFLKPFVTHLRAAEEQASQGLPSIKLEGSKRRSDGTWFNKGTLERFVRFVSTPEVLELVNTFDVEMSQLERARKLYSEGAGDQASGASSGENETARAAAADATKKELLRAIDLRLDAVKQDLIMACARASAAGFTLDNVSELLLFADHFGAQRLNEASTKFISLCQRCPELISHQLSSSPPTQWKSFDDGNVRASSGSDMSIDEPEMESKAPSKPLTRNTSELQLVNKLCDSQFTKHAVGELAATSQPPKPVNQKLTERSVDSGTEEATISGSSVEPMQKTGGGLRRLSVQDRINLFESKQKEQAGSTNSINNSAGSGGTNRLAGKPEHRRLPSDVSVEKLVLRRWSGASDMSIDLNSIGSSSCNDQKESCRHEGTFSPSVNSHTQSASKAEDEASRLNDTATSRSQSGFKDNPIYTLSSSSSSFFEAKVGAFPKDSDQPEIVDPRENITVSKMQEGTALENDPCASLNLLDVFSEKVQQGGLNDSNSIEARSKALSGAGDVAGLLKQAAFETQFKTVFEEKVVVKDQLSSEIPSRAVSTVVKQADQKDRISMRPQYRDVTGADVLEVKSQPNPVTKFKTFGSKTEDVSVKVKGLLNSQLQSKSSSGKIEGIILKSESLEPQSKSGTFPGKEDGQREETTTSNVLLGDLSFEAEDGSDLEGVKLHRKTSAPGQTRKLHERILNQGKVGSVFLGSNPKESLDVFDPPTSSTEHIQVVRPLKGNQELNDELQMKANELEKLFAAHKLKVHGDQVASWRRKPVNMEADHMPKAEETRSPAVINSPLPNEKTLRGSASNGVEFDSKLLLKKVDNKDCSNNPALEIDNYSPPEDLRGKFYEKYMQKRDAKLREDWGSRRAQKEAKMKAMKDSLESSQAEMKAKFAESANRQDPTSACRRAEKMRSFNARAANKDQTVDFLHGEEGLQQTPEQVHYAQDRSYSDTLFGSDPPVSIQSKKLSSSKVMSSTPRTPAAPIPKHSLKGTNSGSMKRRAQLENPLAQSVPNFSDFRKENTKPSTGLSKVTPRAQSRNFPRSKSNNEEMVLVREEKSRRSQSMSKTSATPCELKDLSPLNSDDANLTPFKISKQQTEQILLNKIHRSGESRPFLRKGNGIGPGAGAGIAKLKASIPSEIPNNEEDSEGLVDQQENIPTIVTDEEEEYGRPVVEGKFGTMDFSVETDSEKPRLSQESGNYGGPGSENGDVLRSTSQADDDLAAVSSKFDISVGNMQESPGESPGSWNSHVHRSFSYAQEASDIDASVDSPAGSPASWNSHSLNQMMEADAARMRKKWGSAQIPVLVANAPHQSRKDVTKGFKRLLKFGRKSKGADFLVNDWVSASTASEGDDDTEDGRDQGTRSTDDPRKSRMGYPVAAYDGFNESEIFSDQVQSLRSSIPNPPASFKLRDDNLSGSSLKAPPRSFFSLSTFRSKGNESKFR